MKEKILFVYPHTSTFIDLDIEILSKRFDVSLNTYNWKKKYLVPVYLVHQFFMLCFSIFKFRYVVISFAGYWSLLPVLFGKLAEKKTFLILHGTDAAAFPEIKYGSLRRQPLKQFCKWSLALAYKVLPVSTSLIYSENTYYSDHKIIRQGYRHFFPGIETPAVVIPNCFKIKQWTSNGLPARKPKRFISVASGNTIHLKGIDLILEASLQFPEAEFIIAGFADHQENFSNYKNVHFLGKVSQEDLKKEFYAATFYLQLSIIEGFGCALCEAMLCGCIPIASNVNQMPEIIGNTGYLLYHRKVEELISLIDKLLMLPEDEKRNKSEAARLRVSKLYPVEKREEALYYHMAGAD